LSQTTTAEFPLRHLSVRVPWHDAGWKGVVCDAPHLNGACAKLKGIAGKKTDEQEKPLTGRSLDDLPREQWPCCVDERATFMAPFEMEQVKRHALAGMNPKFYGHFRPTPQRYPPFSAGIVLFAWMMRDNLKRYQRKLAWYRANGVLPGESGAGPRGLLVTTTESSKEGFDSSVVQSVIRRYINP